MEDEFWNCLLEIAGERGEKYVSKLVSDINADRKFANLSSAIRMYVLRHYRDQVDKQASSRGLEPSNLTEHSL